jgi:integrase
LDFLRGVCTVCSHRWERRGVKITKRSVEALRPRSIISDEEIKGFVARRPGSGAVTYGFRYRPKDGPTRQRWLTLGRHGNITVEQARTLAKKRAGEVADARDPVAEDKAKQIEKEKAKLAISNTVNAILDLFVARHVNQLRSGYQIVRAFNIYVRPRIGKIAIYELKRRDIVEMLDAIEDENGPVMADRVLAHVRKAFNWQAARDDQFSPPIVRGMARTKPAERARTRSLSDDEIGSLWVALDSDEVPLPFRNIVRVLLLTAQRRNEVGLMRTEEIDGHTWTIPAERYKTGIPNTVPLTNEARRWIGDREAGFLFSCNGGKKAFNGYSKAKSQLDRVIARHRRKAKLKAMPPWTLHDLRRTARSLMARAGVPSDVAEQVLGHKIPGVRGVYDRHSYAAEKREALEKLGALIERMLDPSANNVLQTTLN